MAKTQMKRARPAKKRQEPQVVEVGVSFEQIVAALTPALLQALPPALAASREVRPAPKPDESPPAMSSKSLGEAKMIPSLSMHLSDSARGLAELLPRLHALAHRSAYQDEPPTPPATTATGASSTTIPNHIDLAQTIKDQVSRAHLLMDVIERSV